jgi:MoCo/4Fe-4S cofactor protein with predicted Tat translocation signal
MPSQPFQYLDLAAIRARLDASRGRDYWRSLEELASSDGFQELLEREFPRQAAEWQGDAAGRRQFLKVMGASLALAGLSACTRQPTETIVPYVRQPEEVIPGKPLFFATAVPQTAVAMGVLVESHLGRPTKVEGNPDHPASLGATDAIAQASVLELYDPDRSQTLTYLGDIRPWSSFLGAVRELLGPMGTSRGAGVRFLTGATTSPTLATQFQDLLKKFPEAKWHRYEPAGRSSARAGAQQAFGESVNTYYQLAHADVILSLDADFLCTGPASVRYAADFASRRRVRGDQTAMNRLYVVESTATATGAKADHHLPLRASEIEAFAAAVAAGVGAHLIDVSAANQMAAGTHAKWIAALVKDLQEHRGASAVIAGDHQSPSVHRLAHRINAALGNSGKTVIYTDPLDPHTADDIASLKELVRDMDAGKVETLVIVGGNPVYNAPVDFNFAQRMSKVKLRIHMGLYADETSDVCQWHIPEAHFLETWSDARAYDGTVTIMQPLILPLYFGRSVHELLGAFSDTPNQTPYEIVKGYWNRQHPAADFEDWWRKAVHDGIVPNTALPARQMALRGQVISRDVIPRLIEDRISQAAAAKPAPAQGLEIVFRPDPHIFDGRYANNGWLQELPKPLSKLTWDNAAIVSPRTAEQRALQNEDLVDLNYQGRTVRAPIWIQPGHPDDSVTVALGYGRTNAGRVGNGVGFNAYALRTSDAPWFGSGLEIVKTGAKYHLATTQEQHLMEGRAIALSANIDEYRKNPGFAREAAEDRPNELTIYPGYKYEGYAWGMAIDQTACVGCNACVVACQSENNIAVVGKEQVKMRRAMHWLRIDSYYKGGLDNPEVYFQPVPCMHCENAPCELVCPVQATNHSAEGLNDMVYNRCVGTRYCSNNCPYKVRRFNFFLYSDWTTPSLKLQRNPDVSVRSRGVMEKCTYCVQRINEAKIESEKEGRPVRDGEIQTACQGACPTQAIVFGNINDPASHVAKMKAEQLNYSLLSELNTKPRTTYLAALRNPNPEIES